MAEETELARQGSIRDSHPLFDERNVEFLFCDSTDTTVVSLMGRFIPPVDMSLPEGDDPIRVKIYGVAVFGGGIDGVGAKYGRRIAFALERALGVQIPYNARIIDPVTAPEVIDGD